MRVNAERRTSAYALLEGIRNAIVGDSFWDPYISDILETRDYSLSVHLGIFTAPYVEYLLGGSKTIESRFSRVRCAPYHRVKHGDIVLVKRSGGPIVALFLAGRVWNYQLTSRILKTIKEQFGEGISPATKDFWRRNESASYATLMRVEHIRELQPIPWIKSDRRGWVVLQNRRDTTPMLFE